jgi:hypothetical protein
MPAQERLHCDGGLGQTEALAEQVVSEPRQGLGCATQGEEQPPCCGARHGPPKGGLQHVSHISETRKPLRQGLMGPWVTMK